jgi:hypothetical protein
MTKTEFLERVSNAKPGDRIVYHVGLLMADRQSANWQTPEAKAVSKALNETANAAWILAGMVKDPFTNRWSVVHRPDVALVQRRLAPSFGFEYIAVKT